MNLKFASEKGADEHVEMGCYGIGVGRTVAACIEQNHDENGIIWPTSLAPFSVGVSFLGEGEVIGQAEKFYKELSAMKIEVLFDDRSLSAGVKLKDMDLVGIPIQLVVGDRAFKEGKCEIKRRRGGQKELVPLEEAISTVKKIIEEERRLMEVRLSEVEPYAA
jgi:prolyl-tRNA synthetase